MPGKPYSIHLRKKKKSRIFYCQFKQPDGSFGPAKSTGQTNRRAAEVWAIEQLQGGYNPQFNNKITFGEYASNFFDWGGAWAKDKRVTGQRLSEKWCSKRHKLTETYLMPAFKNYQLSDITKSVIDNFRNELIFDRGLSGSSVNHILISLRQIFLLAVDQGLIQGIPVIKTVRGEAAKPRKETGILTVEEVRQLFFVANWGDYTSYVCNLAAALTGARRGELLAIQLKNVHPGYIEIQKSWDAERSQLTKTTKSGKPRNVAITHKLQESINRLIGVNPWGKPESFLFYSPSIPEKPIDHKVILKHFARALCEIGIDTDEQKRRKIVFHSHRHFFNTLMVNARLPLAKIQATTGHLTDAMTEHYYHIQLEDMTDITALQDDILRQ